VAPQSYEAVANSAPILNTTIYVGNLVPYTTQADLIPLFQGFGYIHEIRMQADRGFAFVKLDTHDNATKAIVNLNGQTVRGRQLKCSWGKDRSEIVPLLAAAPTPQFMVRGDVDSALTRPLTRYLTHTRSTPLNNTLSPMGHSCLNQAYMRRQLMRQLWLLGRRNMALRYVHHSLAGSNPRLLTSIHLDTVRSM
jgi:RNA recognition motif-containing protein